MTTSTIKAVTLIGLGAMGQALAQALLQQGFKVTVWNRNAAKAAPLQAAGAIVAATAQEAVSASPVVITCITDYHISRSIMHTQEVAAALKGKTWVELSSGTPKEARDQEAWARANDIHYLDGAILATPDQIGRPNTSLFVSGSKTAYDNSEAPLKAIAGALQYMGEDSGAASTWDMGFLAVLFGAMSGFFHGGRVFEAEGLTIGALGNMIPLIAPALGEMLKHQGDTIQSGSYNVPYSSLDLCAGSIDLFIKHAEEAGISSEVPSSIKKIFKRAQDAGYGGEQVAAAYKTY